MANINLLPWREAQRRERNRETLMMCIGIWVVAGILVFLGKAIMDSRISAQEERNALIQRKIDDLSVIIKEIEDIKEKRDELLARMEVIQNLQKNRSRIVHVFDDLAIKLPKGVYYDTVVKNDQKIQINGKAQSNGRVSALMRSLDASDWFDNANLKVVDVVDSNGALVSKFDVDIKEEIKDKDQQNSAEAVK